MMMQISFLSAASQLGPIVSSAPLACLVQVLPMTCRCLREWGRGGASHKGLLEKQS